MAIFFFSFVIFPFFLIKIWYTVISAFGIIAEFSTVAVETVEKIADKYGLIKTGGTDLHGSVL